MKDIKMNIESLEQKIKNIKSVASDFEYLRDEFTGKLFSTINGDVSIEQMIVFAMEYDYLLEHIISTAKKIKETVK